MYVEEIASKLKISRQAAQDHVTQLLDAGLVEKGQGTRASGPGTEYRVVQAAAFNLVEDLRALSATLPDLADPGALLRTQTGGGPAGAPGARGELPDIIVAGGLKPGLRAALRRGSSAPPVSIGRDPSSALLLDWDLMVSNRHAEVRGTADGHAVVDLFSRNGTLLNGERVEPGQPKPLRSGDLLQIGRTLLVYRG
jgi:hypothetical protein